jgi:ABC-type phosphate transport system substrate-binding protein
MPRQTLAMKRRRTVRLLLILGAARLLIPSVTGMAQSGAAKVIVHPDIKLGRIDREELARIYLGKKTLWETGTRIAPVTLDDTAAVMGDFFDLVKKTREQYRAYWRRQVFAGGGAPPRTFRSSAEVVAFVAREPGAIGIVEASISDQRVAVVEVAR